MLAQGMTPTQIHQKYPYYNYFPNTNTGAGYLYYNGYSHGDGKGESINPKIKHGKKVFKWESLEWINKLYSLEVGNIFLWLIKVNFNIFIVPFTRILKFHKR
uniref:Uncharacterized protein n=1 Tax=Panagrolaimus superbus TaxID=310955 RepID=A0A914YYH9_9BILA